MEVLVIIGLSVFSGVMCFKSFKLILHPEQHWHDTVKKLEKEHGEGSLGDHPPSLNPIRIIGIVGAAATGISCFFLTTIVWRHLLG